MKRGPALICAAVFVVIVVLTACLLGRFTGADTPLLGTVTWDAAEVLEADGHVRPVDGSAAPVSWDMEAGDRLRLTVRLPEAGEIPGLYADAYLLMETGAGETTVLLDGEEYFRSDARDGGQDLNYQQLHLPLPADAAGKDMTVLFAPGDTDSPVMPAFARFSSENAAEASSAAYYNQAALTAGADFFGFILIVGILLVELAMGLPDWSLILLALATFLTMIRVIGQTSGYYFLPLWAYQFLSSEKTSLLIGALLIAYLILNSKRSYWRYLGWAALCILATAAVRYGYARLTDGRFSSAIDAILSNALEGYPYALLSWLSTYLLAACGGIAAFSMLQNLIRTRSQARAMLVRQNMMLDNYRAMERSIQDTAVMRHEWKNQISALNILARQGDAQGLERALQQMDSQLERLSAQKYSSNFTVNVILQNGAAKCADGEIKFTAAAPLPQDLPIDSTDLCSLLINMLDNAIRAAAGAEPGRRWVSVSLKISQGFLAVKCDNSYTGPLPLDQDGQLRSGRDDPEGHGYGITQMRLIAKKYGSVLDLSYTDDTFTVQTALQLK